MRPSAVIPLSEEAHENRLSHDFQTQMGRSDTVYVCK